MRCALWTTPLNRSCRSITGADTAAQPASAHLPHQLASTTFASAAPTAPAWLPAAAAAPCPACSRPRACDRSWASRIQDSRTRCFSSLVSRGSLTTLMGDSKWSAGSSTAASTSSVSLGPIICALLYRQLQTQRHDGPVVLFWPHVDDVSEASPPVCDTCGRIHVDPGVRESLVKLGQGSELIIALDQ